MNCITSGAASTGVRKAARPVWSSRLWVSPHPPEEPTEASAGSLSEEQSCHRSIIYCWRKSTRLRSASWLGPKKRWDVNTLVGCLFVPYFGDDKPGHERVTRRIRQAGRPWVQNGHVSDYCVCLNGMALGLSCILRDILRCNVLSSTIWPTKGMNNSCLKLMNNFEKCD